MTSVELCLWMSFLWIAAIGVTQKVVNPLAEAARYQYELNQQSLELIEEAKATCAI